MALKDWEQKSVSKWEATNKYLIIFHIGTLTGNRFRVGVWRKTTPSILINKSPLFKTKTEAIKYAKNYMKKH